MGSRVSQRMKALMEAATMAEKLADKVGRGGCMECDSGEQALRDLADELRDLAAGDKASTTGSTGEGSGSDAG